LVNTKTGEILATTVKKARSDGIDIPSDGKPSGKPPGKPGGKPELGMELTEEGITFPVTLPPVAFTLFDAAIPKDAEEKTHCTRGLFQYIC